MLGTLLLYQSRADVLDDWNDAVLNAIRRENTSPPLGARNLAIMHLAIYDTVNSISPTHEPYRFCAPVVTPASPETAASAAAFRAALALFPSQRAAFEQLWQTHRARLKVADTNSVALGFMVADALLDERAADEAQLALTYIPSAEPGAWRRTPPYFRPPELPQWGCVKPFAMTRCDQFRPSPPPSVNSPEYAAEFDEVKRLGARHSIARNAHDTETARFWSDFTGTVTPPGHWNQIARVIAKNEGLSLQQKARLLALVNVALADAGIACWDAKYKYNSWRPVTAIHRAAQDGNPGTAGNPDWQPLLATPAFPEYVSGHSAFSRAAAEVLARFFGRDEIHFSIGSDSLPAVFRTYEGLSAVAEEIGHSRILGGIHFPSANRAGQTAGQSVGAYVYARLLRPITGLKGPDRAKAWPAFGPIVPDSERPTGSLVHTPPVLDIFSCRSGSRVALSRAWF